MRSIKKYFLTILCLCVTMFGVFGFSSCDITDHYLNPDTSEENSGGLFPGGGGWYPDEDSSEESSEESSEDSSEDSSTSEAPECEHSFGDWTVTTEKTCNQEGEETRSCYHCGETETRSLGFGEHTSEDVATCIAKKICDVCSEEFGDLDPSVHAGELGWIKTRTTHCQGYACCGVKTGTDEAHNKVNGNGKCVICDFNPTISVGTISVSAGEQVSIAISIADNPGVIGLELTVTFDEEVLTLVKAEKGTALAAMDFTAPDVLGSGSKFLWDAGYANVANGEVLLLTFDVSEDAVLGDHSILIKAKGYDENVVSITFKIVNGTITVNE